MKKYYVAVIALFLILYILPLGVRPIAIPDETRYAEIPREMIVSGDWVVPHLNGLKYFEKPVLGYWLNALSITLFGENAFAIRLTSALSAGISALMVFFLIRRFGGGSQTGILGAAAYLTCLLVFALGTINILDSMLSMFLTGAITSFFFAHKENRPSRKFAFLALFGVFCGLAFLIKGFLAFAVPLVTIVPFMLWERRFKELIKISWVPFLTLLIVVLPWCIMVHLRESDFWNYFFWTEHIKRFISPIPGQHPKPFWYFIPILAGGALPWLFLLPAVFSGVKGVVRSKDSLVRFAICWFLFPFLFFSACSGKLIPYILPCFPPLVIIIAIGLVNYFERGKQKAFSICALFFAVVTGGGCGGACGEPDDGSPRIRGLQPAGNLEMGCSGSRPFDMEQCLLFICDGIWFQEKIGAICYRSPDAFVQCSFYLTGSGNGGKGAGRAFIAQSGYGQC